ncbi:MAG: hypothetical protein QOF77_915 [Solirubrobacteraceae bacterium]|nr:hypothetical protein [Solirubrobacteraceae bacterium]
MNAGDEDRPSEAQLTYAWSWFQYHAGQRLTAFNFFLIIVGVVAVAFAQAIDKDWEIVGVAVGALGAMIAIGFLALDVRNEELVDCGREALRALEGGTVHPSRDAHRRVWLEGTGWIGSWASRSDVRRGWISHSRWLRLIELAVAVLFAGAAVWAGFGFPA